MDLISTVDISGDTVVIRANEDFARDYLREDLWVRYDLPGRPPSISEELAVIPFLANVAPIVWLAGLDARAPVLDATFASALDDIRSAYADMYPSLRWDGTIAADRVRPPAESEAQLALLFSGGVDSVHSSLAIDGRQLLVTARGADVAVDNEAGWEAVRRGAIEFGHERGHANAFVESNFRRFLDLAALGRRWPEVEGWWGRVQHGVGLLGLVAPLVPSGRVVIAATHTPGASVTAWGSNPSLDTSVRWGRTEVDHHGYEATRQQKVESIVAAGGPPPQLRVCYSNPYGDGGNCGVCEKCLRTFAGLVVAGAEPLDYGLPMSRREGVRTLRRRFATYRVPLGANPARHWMRIQESLAGRAKDSLRDLDDPEVGEFLTWLSAFDFAAYERRWRPLLRARDRLLRTGRRFPAAERTARRVVAASHGLRSGTRARRGR